LAFGPSPDVCFRLAENLFHIGDLTAARERYYSAIELDEQFVEARASLGCLLVELGRPELAISAFQGALEHHAEYPDVHYHLARQLDDVGRCDEAENHWQTFLKLAPKSPWADEARSRLGVLD
jgi:tetratricopeptide (TPR) repeat protein